MDATASTDSTLAPNVTAFQDVTYSWDFGDPNASGTGTWSYGSNPNGNSMGTATGGIAGHLYNIPDGSNDTIFFPTVTATDGLNSVSCSLQLTIYDASKANGFPGIKTLCQSASGTPVAGQNGCPAGAAVAHATPINAHIAGNISGQRILFKCSDTFTGGASANGIKYRVGSYGSCAGTTVGRPIFSIGAGNGITTLFTSSDGAYSDIDVEGTVLTGGSAAFPASGSSSGDIYPSQILFNNVLVHNVHQSVTSFGGHDIAYVQFVMANMGSTDGIFLNSSENQCLNNSLQYNCGFGGTNYDPSRYASVNYLALLGSSFNGTGATGAANWEVVRISACNLCLIENSVFQNGLNGGAVLKLHDGNSGSTANAAWLGQPMQYVMVTDNLFTGSSGAQLVELAPQNGVTDERTSNLVFERNLINQTINNGTHGCLVLASVQNGSFRDNIFSTATAGSTSTFCLQLARRGIEGSGSASTSQGAPSFPRWPQYDEVYNNTVYGPVGIGFSGANYNAPGKDGWGINNLGYKSGGGLTTVSNVGTNNNTLSNNTTLGNSGNNPNFTNGSHGFSLTSDFQPTANYSGAIPVPVVYDALGAPWAPTWDLGAVSHTAAPPPSGLAPIVKYLGCTFNGIVGTNVVGPEANGTQSNGSRLSLFTNYVDLIGRSNCTYLGRAIDLWDYPPNFTDIQNNINAFNIQLGNTNHIFGEYVAESVTLTVNNYFSTVFGRNFIFKNMCRATPAPGDTDCLASYNKSEYVAYVTQVMTNSINMGIQVYLFGQVTGTDPKGTVASSNLVQIMNNMRTLAASLSLPVLFIGQQPSSFGGSAYLNKFDLIQGGVYMNADGTVPNTAAVNNKGTNAPNRLWLVTNPDGTLKYDPQKLVIEFDWFSNPIDDSSELACLSIPDQGYLNYAHNSQGGCPLGTTIKRTAVTTAQNIYTMLKNLGVGFWQPGRQRIAFPPYFYSPIHFTLAPGTPQQIDFNDENILKIGSNP